MAQYLPFDRLVRDELLNELAAAGFPGANADGLPRLRRAEGQSFVLVDDGESEAAVRAVVEAHDPAAYEAAEAAEAQRRETIRAIAKQRAQATVGIRFDQLTLAQLRDLLAVLFWRADALTATGHVRPLGEWARDVDEDG